MSHQTKITVTLLIFFLLAGIALWLYQPTTRVFPSAIGPVSEAPSPKTSEKNNKFCLAGCPKGGVTEETIVTHHIYELGNNPTTKFADWVAYRITTETLGSGCKRVWATDPDLNPATTLEPTDYRGIREALQSDRGHQAPLASLCGSSYWLEADYLSNITPQKSDLNEGEWEHLENGERNLVKTSVTDIVYSMTGPLYERDMPSLPSAHLSHRVPSGYWKVISIMSHNKIEAVGFIMDQNAEREADFCKDHVSIGEIEKRSHLTLFPTLSREGSAYPDSNQHLYQALGC